LIPRGSRSPDHRYEDLLDRFDAWGENPGNPAPGPVVRDAGAREPPSSFSRSAAARSPSGTAGPRSCGSLPRGW
jgi:hypothetical protein